MKKECENHDKLNLVKQKIQDLLNKQVGYFMPISTVRRRLSRDNLRTLALKKSTNLSQMAKVLQRCFKHDFVFYNSRIKYIGLPIEEKQILWEILNAKPGLTLKQLSNLVPFKKDRYLKLLNKLTKEKKLTLSITNSYVVKIFNDTSFSMHTSASNESTIGNKSNRDNEERCVQQLKELQQHKHYVKICELRQKCQWSTQLFDTVIKELRRKNHIQLHGGNPGKLSDEEIRNSFSDSFNTYFYITYEETQE